MTLPTPTPRPSWVDDGLSPPPRCKTKEEFNVFMHQCDMCGATNPTTRAKLAIAALCSTCGSFLVSLNKICRQSK